MKFIITILLIITLITGCTGLPDVQNKTTNKPSVSENTKVNIDVEDVENKFPKYTETATIKKPKCKICIVDDIAGLALDLAIDAAKMYLNKRILRRSPSNPNHQAGVINEYISEMAVELENGEDPEKVLFEFENKLKKLLPPDTSL